MPSQDILTAYYSWHGNTRKTAEQVAAATGGTLFEIEPVQPCSADYGPTVARAKEEIRQGVRPELKSMPEAMSPSTVFVGTPIWCGTMAPPPVATFANLLGVDQKTVVPFCTHGGGGKGRFEGNLGELCPNATVAPGFGAHGDDGSTAIQQIDSWLSSIRP